MNIAGFLPQSFCDWPGKAAAVIFTPGCNFRCGFCHNKELIEFKETDNERIVLEKIKDLLWSLDGVVITGGEPTLQKDLILFLEKIKSIGIKAKLDTNGSTPEILEEIISKKLVNYIAMDLKTSIEKYPELTKFGNTDSVKKSIELIVNSGIDHEFRTTYVPEVMSEQDLNEAVKLIKNAKRYSLQRFVPKNCLDEKFNSFKSPSHAQLKEIAGKLEFRGEIRLRDEHKESVFKKAE